MYKENCYNFSLLDQYSSSCKFSYGSKLSLVIDTALQFSFWIEIFLWLKIHFLKTS